MMAVRSHETPMDFQWTDSAGPVSKNSEWQRATDLHNSKSDGSMDESAKKRPYSVLESPNKSGNPSTWPEPITPHQTKHLETKPLPITPFNDFTALSFHIPRKFDTDFYSSGPENDTSPEQYVDSEATPDAAFRSISNKTRLHTKSFTSVNQEKQLSGRTFTSGRGAMPRGNYSHAIEKRMQKSRRRDGRQVGRRMAQSELDSDDDVTQQTDQRNNKFLGQEKQSTAASLFNFIETHPGLPHILSFYAQLLLNVFLVFFFIYIVYSFWSTIRADVDKKSQEAFLDIAADIAKCAQNYRENFCESENRPPAIAIICDNWNRCMSRDPETVGRAKVSAHTFAEIFNSFIEPISYKAMLFSVVLVFGCVAISNFAFGFFRSQVNPPTPPLSYMSAQSPKFSGDMPGYWTPYRAHVAHEANPSLDPIPSQTPARMLQYSKLAGITLSSLPGQRSSFFTSLPANDPNILSAQLGMDVSSLLGLSPELMPRSRLSLLDFLRREHPLKYQYNLHRLLHSSTKGSKLNTYNAIPLRDPSGKKTISLLDELFPRETSGEEFGVKRRKTRHVPRQDLDSKSLLEDFGRKIPRRPTKQISRRYLTGKETILVLRNGGKHLIEDDFMRILPSGDHIEAWKRENEITKVFPERNIVTMQRTGVYFLLFPSLLAAEAYKARVERIHDLSQNYSPESRAATLPPAPSLNAAGETLHSLLQSYSLVPPSQDISIQVMQFPFQNVIRDLLENDGYDALVKDRRSNHEVMISPEGFRPSILTMKQAIHCDYKERALQWATVGPNSGIRIMDAAERHNESGNRQVATTLDSVSIPRRSLPVFIISLADDAEAKRFVAAWHRRDISSLIEASPSEDHKVFIVNAEILW